MAHQPSSVLGRWERELSGPSGEETTAGRPLDFLFRYCRRVEPDQESLAEFLRRHKALAEQVLQVNSSIDPTEAEDRERVLRWLDEYQALAARLECAREFLQIYRDFLTTLKEKLLVPWDRALRTRRFIFFRRQSVHIPMTCSERAAIRDGEVMAALETLANAVEQSAQTHDERSKAFESALAQWRTWCSGHAWLESVGQLEREALRQRQAMEESSASWNTGWSEASGRLRQGINHIASILQPYEPLRLPRAAPEEVTARLTRGQRQAFDLQSADAAVAWLTQHWPAPSDRAEAVFALWELGITVPRQG